jgi:hypothetical protein
MAILAGLDQAIVNGDLDEARSVLWGLGTLIDLVALGQPERARELLDAAVVAVRDEMDDELRRLLGGQ